MPRDEVEYEDTWVARLRQHRYPESVVAHSQRAATTHKLHTHVLDHYRPDTVVTQLGIVDCAPRYFRNAERWMLRAVPDPVKSTYMSVMKRLRTRRASRRKVSAAQFRANVSQFYRAALSAGIDVITVAIAPPTSRFVKKSPYIDDAIVQFNGIYSELASEYDNVELIEPFSPETVDDCMVDDHHPNARGHNLVFQQVTDAIAAHNEAENHITEER